MGAARAGGGRRKGRSFAGPPAVSNPHAYAPPVPLGRRRVMNRLGPACRDRLCRRALGGACIARCDEPDESAGAARRRRSPSFAFAPVRVVLSESRRAILVSLSESPAVESLPHISLCRSRICLPDRLSGLPQRDCSRGRARIHKCAQPSARAAAKCLGIECAR